MFHTSADICGGPRLARCRYLRACIDEALRMSPPVPGTLWREMVSDGKNQPLVVDGHVIPPGAQVGVSIYSLHHNEQYFPNSFDFQPERWMEGTQNANHAAFTPFSIGSRGCAGKAMAYLESSLVLAMTLWYFDFKMATGKTGNGAGSGVESSERQGKGGEGEFQIYDLFAASHDGPMLVFHPRGSFCDELAAL
jgi:cytochrome P450